MIMHVTYECEICHTSFERSDNGFACERQGTPEPPAYLAKRIGLEVAGFGESGIETAVLHALYVERSRHAHELYAQIDIHLSHNQNYTSGVPVTALDPYDGWDFMRYVPPTEQEFLPVLDEWARWCELYEIEPNPRKTKWWECRFQLHPRAEGLVDHWFETRRPQVLL